MSTYAFRSYEFFLLQYRRVWRTTLVTSLVNPTLYLAALGIGLGKLVNRGPGGGIGGGSYLHFVAPGLLAAAAMQIASTESSWPVMGSFRWTRTYYAMNATPLAAPDILAGQQLFVATRVVLSAAAYLVVIAAFGGVESPLAILAVPSALLVGLAFSAPIAALAGWAETESIFNALFRFVVMPMFLFSGTFYPVSRLPEVLQWVAYATPLWHGVELCRDLVLGQTHVLDDLGHAGYLLLWGLVGLGLAVRTHRERLLR
jgi:lipooligosaccharide transport system permease protein